MPFPDGSRFHDFVMAAMVAFHSPMLHQHRLAICKADHLRVTADNICQQATGAAVAMFIMISVIHLENAEAPKRGLAMIGFTCRPGGANADSCLL